MRINKYIASCGVTSRRKADALIEEGRVKVNGRVLREPGYDVQPEDRVEVLGQEIHREEKKVYYLLNKPVGYVTTTQDEKGRPTVLDLVPNEGIRLFPVGRLDCNTSGLLLLTNDGEAANRIMHPSHDLDKTYRAVVAGIMTRSKAQKLERGVDLGGFFTAPAKVELLRHNANSTVLDLTIHEGKNHQVRRMCKAVGHPVQMLDRIAIGRLVKGRLAVGGYRKLSPEEIRYLTSL